MTRKDKKDVSFKKIFLFNLLTIVFPTDALCFLPPVVFVHLNIDYLVSIH